MSTLRLTTISNQTGSSSVPSETVINGSAKAWVNFNGTGTVAIRASFNVSSITDGGVGIYTINFTNALADTNYAASLAVVPDVFFSSGNAATRSFFVNTVATTSIQILTGYQSPSSGSAGLDYPSIYVAIFR